MSDWWLGNGQQGGLRVGAVRIGVDPERAAPYLCAMSNRDRGEGCDGQMTIELPAQPASKARPTTGVRGVVLRDLERELAAWACANQEAMGDAPVAYDDHLLEELALHG